MAFGGIDKGSTIVLANDPHARFIFGVRKLEVLDANINFLKAQEAEKQAEVNRLSEEVVRLEEDLIGGQKVEEAKGLLPQ